MSDHQYYFHVGLLPCVLYNFSWALETDQNNDVIVSPGESSVLNQHLLTLH